MGTKCGSLAAKVLALHMLGSHVSAGFQNFGPSLTAFLGHKQGAGWEVELPVLEPTPIWDPRVSGSLVQ